MDKREEKKENKHLIVSGLNFLAIGLVALLIGVGLFFAFFADEWAFINDVMFDLLFLAIGIITGINIHELGHLAFGRAIGYRLLSYSMGPLTWINENGKMKFSIRWQKGYAGLCSMMPPEKAPSNFQYSLYYSGGIVFNAFSALIIALPYSVFGGSSEHLNSAFLNIILCWLLLGGMNFLPFILANNPTDGKLIWSFIFKSPFTETLVCLNKISAQRSSGIRPKDIQISCAPNLEKPNAFDMILVLNLYFKALDSGDDADMKSYADLLEKNIRSFSSISLPAVYYELCFTGCVSGDKGRAELYYQKAKKMLKRDKDINGLRLKAYYEYYINGNSRAALNYCGSALKVAGKYPSKGQAKLEVSLVERLRDEIEGPDSKLEPDTGGLAMG